MKPIRIELPTDFTAGPVNAYLFTEPEPILVDTGVKSVESWAALEAGLEAHGLRVADLSKVIITHPHVDHFGQAGQIAARSRAQVWVSDLAIPWVVDFAGMWRKRIAYYVESFLPHIGFSPQINELIVSFMENVMGTCESVPADRIHRFQLDGHLDMGGCQWQVVYTPGHTHFQTCFFQPDSQQLLSADMLLAKTPTPIVERPVTGSQRLPGLPRFLESLDLIESLDVDTVYPGHGEPFIGHRELVQHQRRRIHLRKEECLTLIGQGHRKITALLDAMYSHIPMQHRFVGLWMLIGYLDLLKADGRIVERQVDGIWHYYEEGLEVLEPVMKQDS